MSDDAMEWLETQERFRRAHDGKDLTPNRLGNDFLRMKPVERANVLADLDNKIAGAHLTLNEARKLHAYRRALLDAHQSALRVKR